MARHAAAVGRARARVSRRARAACRPARAPRRRHRRGRVARRGGTDTAPAARNRTRTLLRRSMRLAAGRRGHVPSTGKGAASLICSARRVRGGRRCAAGRSGRCLGLRCRRPVRHDDRHHSRRPATSAGTRARDTANIRFAQDVAVIYLGRRPAFPQSVATPLRGRVIAIGDAAFSHDPIGGRGLSFALGSAFAAAAVLKTWRDHPARWQCACGCVLRRLRRGGETAASGFLIRRPAATHPQPLPSHVGWAAEG